MLLVERLQEQAIVRNDPSIADAIARNAFLREFRPGETLIRQDDPEPRLHFLLEGQVAIRVGGVEVAARKAGEQVGEMALVEPSRQSPTEVVATVPTLSAVIDERTFRGLAREFPGLWRNIARILARRLREQGGATTVRREAPRLFIGSTPAAVPVVEALRVALAPQEHLVRVATWRDARLFPAGRSFVESLVTAVQEADFGLLVVDAGERGGDGAAREALLYQLGLFTGILGRERIAVAMPEGVDPDLPGGPAWGVCARYRSGDPAEDGPVDVVQTLQGVGELIRRLGPRRMVGGAASPG